MRLQVAAGDVDAAVGIDEDIGFATDAKLRKINSGFDREAGAGHDAAFFLGFQAVHVGAVAVGFLADAVAGAVEERVAIAGLFDHVAGSLVNLPTLQWLLFGEGVLHAGDGGVAGLRHDLKDLFIFLGDLGADKAGPGEVAIDRSRFVELGPEIDQDEVALADDAIGTRLRLVMGVAAMRSDANDRSMVGDEIVALEMFENLALHIKFVDEAVAADALGDESKRRVISRRACAWRPRGAFSIARRPRWLRIVEPNRRN